MSGGKKSEGFFDSKYNKAALITLEIAVLLTVVVITVFILFDGSKKESEEEYIIQTQSATENAVGIYETFSYNLSDVSEGVSEALVPDGTQTHNSGQNEDAYTPETTAPSDVSVKLSDPSGWSTAQIVAKAADAVNKTKNYKQALSVHHKETFDATVTECSGGTIVKTVADMMVGWVVTPTDETLNYKNGSAVNSEGETVPVLLPLKNSFYLSADGVKSASAKISGNEYVLNLKLVEEKVGMYNVPKHNASAIGYLDVANFDLSFLTIDSASITYKGSSVELHINKDGYVTYAEYHIPMYIKGSGHSGSISGSVAFDGEQTEIWDMKY